VNSLRDDDGVRAWEGRPVEAWAARWGVAGVEAYGVLDSTNDRARALLERAPPDSGVWVVLADEQLRGRGRGGSVWHSPAGAGLWLSLAVPGAQPAPKLPLRIGMAVAHAVEACAPGVRAGIKWPNDIFVEGRKLGGVLCEGVGRGVIVGVGVNVRPVRGALPDEVATRAISLEEAVGRPVSRAELATELITRARDAARRTGKPLSSGFLEEMAGRDVLRGVAVVTSLGAKGIACGVAPDGALLVERTDGTRVPIRAGSVRPAEEPS